MSLLLCPECGNKISTKAISCPHCGYTGNDPSLPITSQENYINIPTFKYDMELWTPVSGELEVMSVKDNKILFQHLGTFEKIKNYTPSIAETISEMAKNESILVANIDPYIQKLIDKGIYKLNIDKQGEILLFFKS